mmetsp:Transcript_6265/g.20600  ORF Transcript_6265/g.20600 Transcript_6265/m.20600 type:complete len:432 (+) Transcript_6265:1455-2750(+)
MSASAIASADRRDPVVSRPSTTTGSWSCAAGASAFACGGGAALVRPKIVRPLGLGGGWCAGGATGTAGRLTGTRSAEIWPPATAPPSALLMPDSKHDTPPRGSSVSSGRAGRQNPRMSDETIVPSPPPTVSRLPRPSRAARETEKAAGTCSRTDTSDALARASRADSRWFAPRQFASSRPTSPVMRPRDSETDGSKARKRAGLPPLAPRSTTCSSTSISSSPLAEGEPVPPPNGASATPLASPGATRRMRGASIRSNNSDWASLAQPVGLSRHGSPGRRPSMRATASPRVVPLHRTSCPRLARASNWVGRGTPHERRAEANDSSARWSDAGRTPARRARSMAASMRAGAAASRYRSRINGGSRGIVAAKSSASWSERRTLVRRPWSGGGGAGGASTGEKNSMQTGSRAARGSEASKTRWPSSTLSRDGTLA